MPLLRSIWSDYTNCLSKQRTKSNCRDCNNTPFNTLDLLGATGGRRGVRNCASLGSGLRSLSRSRRVDSGRGRRRVGRCVKQDVINEVDYAVRNKDVAPYDVSG